MCSHDSTDQTKRAIRNVESQESVPSFWQLCQRDKGLHVAAFIVLWAADDSMKMGSGGLGGEGNCREKHEKFTKKRGGRLVAISRQSGIFGPKPIGGFEACANAQLPRRHEEHEGGRNQKNCLSLYSSCRCG
jgi:hypothetical protein